MITLQGLFGNDVFANAATMKIALLKVLNVLNFILLFV